MHDLVLMASATHYDTCDFTGSQTLVPLAAESGIASYYLPCSETGSQLYLTCSVPGHCAAGQKLSVRVSTSSRVFSTTDPSQILLHSDSLARVMTLLGYRVESNGFVFLDRGFSTEASANVSLELVWCLEAHCPSVAWDWNPTATNASCLADVYNLGGFLSRRRPLPQYEHAEQYYLIALGHVPTHCPSLSYLSQLCKLSQPQSRAGTLPCRLNDAYGVVPCAHAITGNHRRTTPTADQ